MIVVLHSGTLQDSCCERCDWCCVCAEFPWGSSAAVAKLAIPDSKQFITSKGAHIADAAVLDHAFVMYYFSAHWCVSWPDDFSELTNIVL